MSDSFLLEYQGHTGKIARVSKLNMNNDYCYVDMYDGEYVATTIFDTLIEAQHFASKYVGT